MKYCPDCGEEKPLDEFYDDKIKKDGKQSYCKECLKNRRREWCKANPDKLSAQWRRADLKKKYGITVERYDEMLAEQGGVCGCCGTTEPGRGDNNFCVDHCHDSDEIRGLLCNNCNRGLGFLGDDLDGIMNMVYYLLQNQMESIEIPEPD